MKAITLLQPRASLVAVGAEQYETRSWAPQLVPGELLAIHAAARPVARNRDGMKLDAGQGFVASTELPRGCVLAELAAELEGSAP